MKPIEDYVEKAARLLNLKRSGLLTREEFAKEAAALALEYTPEMKKVGLPDFLHFAVSLIERIQVRADELRSV